MNSGNPVGDRADLKERINEFRRLFANRLVAECGFKRNGSSLFRRNSEMSWVVKLEREFGGPQLALRMGIALHEFTPEERLTYPAGEVSLEFDGLSLSLPEEIGPDVDPLSYRRGWIRWALSFHSNSLEDDERMVALDFIIEELCRVTGRVQTVQDLREFVHRPDVRIDYALVDVQPLLGLMP